MRKRKISATSQGKRADVEEYRINRILPNNHVNAVGPFVFLDHLLPSKHSPNEPRKLVNGTNAHPHRGIATLTYILNGEADHFDSAGNHAKVKSGGIQWMKAGNGVIHDEAVNVDKSANDLLTHGLQFWINLPSSQKTEAPGYIPVQSNKVPKKILKDEAGWLKVIAGEFEDLISKIPSYSKQYLYHIHLDNGKTFSIDTRKDWEYAAFLPLNSSRINGADFAPGEFLLFENSEGSIEIDSLSHGVVDVVLFGGEPYTEPIIAEGPFVMNTRQEIATAYADFYLGKYGKISYQ